MKYNYICYFNDELTVQILFFSEYYRVFSEYLEYPDATPLLRSYLPTDLYLCCLSFRVFLRNLYTVGYTSIWIVMDLSIDISLALDRSIQFLHAYYQIPMSGIRTSTATN